MTLELWIAQNTVLFTVIVLIASVWGAVWKGIALWKSARNKNLVWFIVLLVVNTVGILEILYIFVFSKHHKKTIIKKKRR